MPFFFLDVDAAEAERFISFRLSDEAGRHLAAHQLRLEEQRPGLWESIFDAGGYVRRFAEVLKRVPAQAQGPKTPQEVLSNIGVFIGEQVLGSAITNLLLAGIEQRTLMVRLPDAARGPLSAALLRVPWELAALTRGPNAAKACFDQNVIVRAAPAGLPDAKGAPLGRNEMLRVLLVFADTSQSGVLGMRREREQLMDVFVNEVMPERLVRADVLCHGVTRDILRDAVQSAGGYHIVHWSGHGRHDALELCAESGADSDLLTSAELVDLFRTAGGFIPQLFFLSACNSGAAFGPEGFSSLQAYLRGVEPASQADGAELGESAWQERKGFGGTAFELLRAGVPQVIGMRFEVTDSFARELGAAFYRILLSQRKAHAADAALAMARFELRSAECAKLFHPVDHATPLFFGDSSFGFEPAQRRSPALDSVHPRPQPLLHGSRDLEPPDAFVGRRSELAALGTGLRRVDKRALIVICGPAGIGKTSLAAEAIHLWHQGFDWVFAFQAKRPEALLLEEFYKRLHKRLLIASPDYRARCANNAFAALFIEASELPEPGERAQLLLDNLISLMRSERLLLVLDNADASLSKADAKGLFGFADPAWDRMLSELGNQIRGSGSRVIVVSRFKLFALSDDQCRMELELGPLTPEESALLLEELLGRDNLAPPSAEEERRLLRDILSAGRGHPFLLRRLYALFASNRDAIKTALEYLSVRGGKELDFVAELLAKSPSSSSGGQAAELRSYLDVIAKSGF